MREWIYRAIYWIAEMHNRILQLNDQGGWYFTMLGWNYGVDFVKNEDGKWKILGFKNGEEQTATKEEATGEQA